jgi:hypothetical protein
MINRINRHLRTRYPLLWNMRLPWLLPAIALLHLLFFFGGYASLKLFDLKNYYSTWMVNGFESMALSVLCSLLVWILWLLFYLRNNAFKNFYAIGRWHLLREFLLTLLILFSSAIFFESFQAGVRARARNFTPRTQFISEVNAVNLGAAFVPVEKPPYFIFSSCSEKRKDHPRFYNYTDEDTATSGKDSTELQRALARPDAFAYTNYCQLAQTVQAINGIDTAEQQTARRNSWIDARRTDSIARAIEGLLSVCRKYGINYRLNTAMLTQLVYATPVHALTKTIAEQEESYEEGMLHHNPWYIDMNALGQALNFVEGSHDSSWPSRAFIELYVALSLATWLFIYRRFSRRVFLLSFVGVLLWLAVIGLMAAASRGENGVSYLLLLLGLLFWGLGWLLLQKRTARTASGVLLSWHYLLLPYLLLIVIHLVENYFRREQPGGAIDDRLLRAQFPVASWVHDNSGVLFLLNLLFAIAYIAFAANATARRWQAAPQE